jgi:hypothetical protein
MFKIILQEFVVEQVTKGRQSYEKGVVTYTYNGANKTYQTVSFANPEVFKVLKSAAPGTILLVETTKNAAGYDQWAKVSVEGSAGASEGATSRPAPAGATRVAGSNYETPEERKQRQLLIVRQSSITSAIATLAPGSKTALNPDDVLVLAQSYVDFVYGVDEALDPDNPEAGA